MNQILSLANSGLAIIVVLGLCLFCHELGHFLAAKACRMAVYEFAMGFGPALWRRQRGETLYALRAVPFGGYVRIAGMEPGEAPVERGFHTRPRWQGAIVVCAGTFMNVLLAMVLYWIVNVVSGIPVPDSKDILIRSVFSGGIAQTAGIRADDKILRIGDSRYSSAVEQVAPNSVGAQMGLKPGHRVFQVGEEPVATPADVVRVLSQGLPEGAKIWALNEKATSMEGAVVAIKPPPADSLASLPPHLTGAAADQWAGKALGVTFGPLDQFTVHRFISNSPGKKVALTVVRDSGPLRVELTPKTDTDRVEYVDRNGKLSAPHRSVGRIGIVLGPELRRPGVIEGFKLAAGQSYQAVATVVISLQAMATKKIAAEPTGPIGIMAMTAETAKLGWASVLALCGLISANLAVINMFPIPPFDGFHVLLLGIEGLIRRRVDHRLEMMVRVAGFILIINLFIFLAFRDILNLVRYGTY